VCLLTVATTYYFPTEDEDDEPTAKEKMLLLCMKGIDVFCVWDCCWLWLKIQEGVAFIVFDPFVELFITLCIVVNTLFMALDHYDMDKNLDKTLKSGNYVSWKHGSLTRAIREQNFNFRNAHSFSALHSLSRLR